MICYAVPLVQAQVRVVVVLVGVPRGLSWDDPGAPVGQTLLSSGAPDGAKVQGKVKALGRGRVRELA